MAIFLMYNFRDCTSDHDRLVTLQSHVKRNVVKRCGLDRAINTQMVSEAKTVARGKSEGEVLAVGRQVIPKDVVVDRQFAVNQSG